MSSVITGSGAPADEGAAEADGAVAASVPRRGGTLCGVPAQVALWLALLIPPVAFLLNYAFVFHCHYSEIMRMNDVPDIMKGYHRVPTLAAALTAYWHAPWIQKPIYCFRPISGFQYWVETYVGLHFGFLWDAWIGGFALFAISVWLCAMIAYRFTGSASLTVFAALMACWVRSYNVCQPNMWLAWYPMHQDLLMMVFILGAVLSFDAWISNGSRGALIATWVLFVLGCLTKEYLYAFPFMAASLILVRPAYSWGVRKARLLQPALFALFVLGLLILRKTMYAHPRNPNFRKDVILHKPFMFMYNNLASDVIIANWAPVIFAAVLVAVVCGVFYVRRRQLSLGWLGRRPYVIVAAVIALLFVLLQVACGSFAVPVVQLFTIQIMQMKCATNVALLASILVTIRNWNRGAMAAAWLLLFWSYLPVISFIGWHYTFPGGLFRSFFWAVWAQAFAGQLLADFPRIPAVLFSPLKPARAA